MRRQRKANSGIGEEFLPDEARQLAASDVADLRERLVQVEQQVLAQYTATAAYATIGRQHADEVRAEARADLDRVQSTVVSLMEKLRAEVLDRFRRVEERAGATDPATGLDVSRMSSLEAQMAAVLVALDNTQRENRELREQLDAVLQRQMRADGWLASDGPAESLAMR